jgi:Flp pilus assembly protein TadG
MIRIEKFKSERGATLVNFAIASSLLFTALFGVIEFGRLFWTHSALKDAARRGARYATVRKNDAAGIAAVQKMAVYGDPNADPATAVPVVPGLTTSNVDVQYQNYAGILLSATAKVSITNFQFNFAIPLVGTTITMPAYETSLPGESAGFIPCDYPSAAPYSACNTIPN